LPRPPRSPPFPYTTLFRSPGQAPARRAGSGDGARPHGGDDHLGAVAGAELAGDPGEVALDREGRQAELLADVLVRLAVRHQLQRSEEHTSELQSLAYLVCR